MKKQFSEAVCAACIIAAMLTIFAECATAQGVVTGASLSLPVTTELRHARHKIPWNNHAYFEQRTPTKFLNWGDYLESWDKKQWATWAAFAGAGAMWGAREAYHRNPTCFETRWGVSDRSFFGSEAWARNYKGNDPEQPHKSEWAGNFGRDVWHTFGFGSKALMVGGTFAIGARKQPMKYRVANLAIGWGIQSLFANFVYANLP